MVERVYPERDMPPMFGKENGHKPVPNKHGTGFFYIENWRRKYEKGFIFSYRNTLFIIEQFGPSDGLP